MSYDYSSQAGGGGGYFEGGTQGAGDSGGNDRRRDNELGLRPVTIRQILNAEQISADIPPLIDGKEVKNVTFVGRVVQPSSGDVFSSFTADDGTGNIDVRLWGSEETQLPVEENEYARVRGAIKSFNDKNLIYAQTVHKVTDPNELVFHGLQAAWAHLRLTKNAEGGVSGGAAPVGASAPKDNTPVGRVTSALADLSPENPEGVTIAQIRKRVPALDDTAIDQALGQLEDTGAAYHVEGEDADLWFYVAQ